MFAENSKQAQEIVKTTPHLFLFFLKALLRPVDVHIF